MAWNDRDHNYFSQRQDLPARSYGGPTTAPYIDTDLHARNGSVPYAEPFDLRDQTLQLDYASSSRPGLSEPPQSEGYPVNALRQSQDRPFPAEDYLADPHDFYLDFRDPFRRGSPQIDTRNDFSIDGTLDGMTSSTYPRKYSGPSSRNASATSKIPPPGQRVGSRTSTRPSPTSTLTNTSNPTTKPLYNSSRNQQPSLRDLVNRFNQNSDETLPLPSKPNSMSSNLLEKGSHPRSRIRSASQIGGKAPVSRLPKPNDRRPSGSRPVPQRKALNERPQATSSRSASAAFVLTQHSPYGNSLASRSMGNFAPPGNELVRRPLFGEILNQAPGSIGPGFGIADIKPASSQQNAGATGQILRPRRRSELDISPSSPTAWYLGLDSLEGVSSRDRHPAARPKHRRARSDFSGTVMSQKSPRPALPSPINTTFTPSTDRSTGRSPQSNSQSRIPRRRETSLSDSGDSPTTLKSNLSPNRPSALLPSPARGSSGLPRPKPLSKPDSPGRKRPITPVRTVRGRYEPNYKNEGIPSSSMKAYISAPPEKQSPPLRSSRPRLPVSAATTSASRGKLTDRLEKLQAPRKPAERPRPKPIRELGSIDFAARRERIQKAIKQEAEDKEKRLEEERKKRAATLQKDALQQQKGSVIMTSPASTTIESDRSTPIPQETIEASRQNNISGDIGPAESPEVAEYAFKVHISEPEDESSKRETIFDDLESPVLVIPGGFPDSLDSTPEVEQKQDPLSTQGSPDPNKPFERPEHDGADRESRQDLERTRTVLSHVMKLRESSPSSQEATDFAEISGPSDKEDAESVRIILSSTTAEVDQPVYDNYPWEDGPPVDVFTPHVGTRGSVDRQSVQDKSDSLESDYVHISTATVADVEKQTLESSDHTAFSNADAHGSGSSTRRSRPAVDKLHSASFNVPAASLHRRENYNGSKQDRSPSTSAHWEASSESYSRASDDLGGHAIRRSYADTDKSYNGGSESANTGRLSYYNVRPGSEQDQQVSKSGIELHVNASGWTGSVAGWLALDPQDTSPGEEPHEDERPPPPPKDDDLSVKPPPVPAKVAYDAEELEQSNPRARPTSRAYSPLPKIPAGEDGLGLAIQVQPPVPDHSPPPPPIRPTVEEVTSSVASTTTRAQSYSSSAGYSPMAPPSISPHMTQDTTPNLRSHPRRSEDSSVPSVRNSTHQYLHEDGRQSRADRTLSESDEKRIKQRKYRIKELVDTELSYFVDMMVLVEIYKKSMQAVDWVSPEEIKILFANADQMVVFSGALYDSLRRAAASIYIAPAAPTWSGKETSRGSMSSNNTIPDSIPDLTEDEKDRMTSVGTAFRPHTNKLEKVYGEYIKNHGAANVKVQKLTAIPEFLGWQDQCRMMAADLTNAWSLDSLLIKPTQRVLKYHLLLEEILDLTPVDHPDYAGVEITWREMKGIGMRLDKLKERVELIGTVLSTQPTESRKRKESDVRSGLAKAFGRRTEKFRQQVGLSEMVEDFEYKALADAYGEHYAKLQLSMRDVQDYIKEAELWVLSFQDLAMAFEGTLDDLSSSYPELESKWRRFGMFVREIAQKALPEHLSGVKRQVLEPMITLIQVHEGPQKLMQKRAKRLVDYARFKAIKDRGDKIDKKTQEQGEQFIALNESLKDELPKLFALTAKLMATCLGILAHLQHDWMIIWVKKLKPIVYEQEVPESLELIIKEFENGDFPYTEAIVTGLGMCNGAILAEIYNFLASPAGFLTENSSPTTTASRNRAVSLNHEGSPSLPLPEVVHRHSGGNISFESLLVSQNGIQNGPTGPNQVPPAGRTRATSAMGNHRTENLAELRTPRSASGGVPANTGMAWTSLNANGSRRSGSIPSTNNPYGNGDIAPPLQQTTSIHSTVSTQNNTPPSPGERPFSGLFSSAMPMSDSPEVTQPPSPRDAGQYNVLFCVASLFDFNIERGRREAGYPYLNYVSGEIFDVVGEKGNLWLAKNQDDNSNTLGWIWNKHFAKLEGS